MLNKVRKKVEVQKRGTPYSKEKVRRKVVMQCFKARVLQAQEKVVNKKAIDNIEKFIEIEINAE